MKRFFRTERDEITDGQTRSFGSVSFQESLVPALGRTPLAQLGPCGGDELASTAEETAHGEVLPYFPYNREPPSEIRARPQVIIVISSWCKCVSDRFSFIWTTCSRDCGDAEYPSTYWGNRGSI